MKLPKIRQRRIFFHFIIGTTQPGVPLWVYFGPDVPDHHGTKMRRIRFLTYFDSAMSDIHVESGNIKKFR